MKEEYYFKQSKVKGNVYLQIWKRDNGSSEFVYSLGSASGCLKKLVSAGIVKRQTNFNTENVTNFSEGENEEKD